MIAIEAANKMAYTCKSQYLNLFNHFASGTFNSSEADQKANLTKYIMTFSDET